MFLISAVAMREAPWEGPPVSARPPVGNTSWRVRTALLVLCALPLVAQGCGSEPAPRVRARPSTWTAEAEAVELTAKPKAGAKAGEAGGATKAGPKMVRSERSVTSSPEKIAAGAKIFAQNCVKCHGEAGVGQIGVGPRLDSETFLAAASDKMLLETIANGREGTTMTPWKLTVDSKARESLVAYIRSLHPHEPAELDESAVSGDSARGAEVFRTICAACHGRDGAGYIALSSGNGIGRRGFLSTVTDGYLRYMIEHGKSQTKMRGFDGKGAAVVANLTAQQIDDVIVHLRENAW
ncbi:MAG TPA: c-type cytochrome [Nannocystis exedens]|nr:c-type cytochrome [Nannocystis exedens]